MTKTTLGKSDLQVPSLVRLERNSVDLYQHHFPSNRVSIPKLMELMADAVEAGKVKAVGVSNYSAEQMRIAHAALASRGIPLASNQSVLAIPGAKNGKQAADNAGALSFSLTAAEIEALYQATLAWQA